MTAAARGGRSTNERSGMRELWPKPGRSREMMRRWRSRAGWSRQVPWELLPGQPWRKRTGAPWGSPYSRHAMRRLKVVRMLRLPSGWWVIGGWPCMGELSGFRQLFAGEFFL